MEKLQKEYLKLLDSMDFQISGLDYSLVDKHIENLKSSPFLRNTAVSIYDNCRRCHVFESDYHKTVFKDEDGVYRDMRIHPEDIEAVIKNAISALRHVFMMKIPLSKSKMIRQYRALINGNYKRIVEEMQILEADSAGNPWLTLSIVNLSSDQEEPFIVKSRFVDTITGDTFLPLDEFYNRCSILTAREIEILKRISQGLLSKEISALFGVSVHTVNTHRQHILSKLKVNNSIEAVKYASALGLLPV